MDSVREGPARQHSGAPRRRPAHADALVSCPANTCHFAGPYRGAGKARARVQAGRLAPWPQRSMRPDTAQPEGFGACGALAGRWPGQIQDSTPAPVEAPAARRLRSRQGCGMLPIPGEPRASAPWRVRSPARHRRGARQGRRLPTPRFSSTRASRAVSSLCQAPFQGWRPAGAALRRILLQPAHDRAPWRGRVHGAQGARRRRHTGAAAPSLRASAAPSMRPSG